MKRIAALAAACCALLFSSAASADGCMQKWNDTGFACLKLHNKAACEGQKGKFHGKEGVALCEWTVPKPKSAQAHKAGCEFCGDPAGGFITSPDAKTGKFMAVFKASQSVDAAGGCPKSWIRFSNNAEALGATAEAAIQVAKTSNVCK